MIENITIQKHKSFQHPEPYSIQIPKDKTATYIYGINGAGKSSIGEVIDGVARKDPQFTQCRIQTTGNGPYRYMVYNQNFVDRVIDEPLKGIFTVGELDKNRQKRIQEIENRIQVLEKQIESAQEQSQDRENRISKELERAKEEVWKAYNQPRIKNSPLSGLLEGLRNNRTKFFQELRKYPLPAEGQLDTLERLEKRWADASGTEDERPLVSVDTHGLRAIEHDPIWEDPIEVSTSSRLASLISKLGNADWVAHGQKYLHTEQCPFCQQRLPDDFHDELTRLLEGERKAKVDKIDSLIKAYKTKIEALGMRMQDILSAPDAAGTGIETVWSKLHGQLRDNLTRMQAKQAEPSAIISIKPTNTDELQQAIADLNALITDFNERVRDRKGERERIKTMFFQLLHADRAEAYARHDELLKPLQDEKKQFDEEVQAKKPELEALQEELRELRRQQKGIDASIESINERLKILGITEFSIQRKPGEDRVYCLQRPRMPNFCPRSLSEGEKTLIAFLYFMELLKGSHNEEEHIDPNKTIAVIDDPISSLSQNYIYDIATMIHHELVNPRGEQKLVKQVIVLTHNLFFFHELIRLHRGELKNAHKKCGLLRVVKNIHSEVQPLDPTTLQNDYDAWWQILKDAQDGKVPIQVVPNAMRNILEQFFAFTTGKSDFPEAVKALADEDTSNKYQALNRFMDRGSHSDGINGSPIDWTQYDAGYLLGKFRAMFKAIGREDHYLMKMGETTPLSPLPTP